MTDRVVDIEIFGERYKIRVKGEEDERYIGQLISIVDQKMNEVAVKSKSSDTTKIAVLAALNLADELTVARRTLDALDEIVGRMETELETLDDPLERDDHTFPLAGKAAR